MQRKFMGLAAAALLVLAACAPPDSNAENAVEPAADDAATAPDSYAAPAHAQETAQAAPSRMVTVADGTLLDVKLLNALNSGTNQVGDPFTVELIEPVRNEAGIVIPAGSWVRGSISEVKKAKRGAGQASLTLVFSAIELPDGFTSDVTASLSQESESKKKRNAAVIGGSAAGGALLGRVIGDDTKGAVVGAVIGGAIGTGVILSKEGEQVDLPEGTAMTIHLDAPLQVPSPA